jgi:hypothetical protein
MTFPQDRYTPYGYLDLPGHTRRLNPLGVLRSEGVGFCWHFPAFAGGYGGYRAHYVAGFQVALGHALEISDFDEADCPYHSKNIVEFHLRTSEGNARAIFHPVGEHTLRCRLEVQAGHAMPVAVIAQYHRLIGATGEWGESGLVGRREGECIVLQGFEGGEAFLLACSARPHYEGITAEVATVQQWWERGAAPGILAAVPVLAKPGEEAALYAIAGFHGEPGPAPQALEIYLVRGLTVPRAQAELARARAQGAAEEARLRTADARFWEEAPQLEGDWPEHFRRGLVYDLETVRMMVKPPSGIYHSPWDAMQIQAPRVVLAETAMDALLLAYADPAIAAEMLRGTFADAPEPNVPCSREDGSYNMVAADGTVCGTSPAWGYPWRAIAQLAALYPERRWIELLYPHLAEYLEWWLAQRRDGQGWLFYACSWESGQDGSPRFGEQPLGGGHPTRHVRPVDLHAAMAHAAQVLAGLAAVLGQPGEQARWQALAVEFRERTERLWNGRRYADYDARAGRLSAVDDVMLLAPVALGVAQPERVAALRPAIAALDAQRLDWPMFAWTAVDAALQAGLSDKAGELAAAVCERAYRRWDARSHTGEQTLPGIAAEYWPASGRGGGEGYGWGAFTTHLLLHALIGLSFSPTHLLVRPNMPLAWRQAGRRYTLRWHCRGRPLAISLQPLAGERVALAVNEFRREAAWGEEAAFAWEEL